MSILDRLNDEKVFRIELSEDKKTASILEACDQWFGVDLSKQELGQLISELSKILNEMSEQAEGPKQTSK